MARTRVPAHVTDVKSNGFGMDVVVRRQPYPKSDFSPSGHPVDDDQQGGRASQSEISGLAPGNRAFRHVIPPGEIGSRESYDPQLPPPQYVDTVAHYRDEEKDPSLHNSMAAMRSADRGVPFQEYGPTWQPRSAPMPRARQDEGYLGPLDTMSADPLMTDADSSTLFAPREVHRKDLYGDNRDGMLHNDPAHPGFAAVQSKIAAKEGVSQKAAGAILASASRGASKGAKKANPRLNRVKG